MKIAQKSLVRMKNILKTDKEKISVPLINMIKSDFYGVVSNYFHVRLEDLSVSYTIDSENMYDFCISFKSNRIKRVNFLNR